MNVSEVASQEITQEKPFLAAINPDGVNSINEVLALSCQRFSDQPAYTSLGRTLTYTEVDRLSADFAAFLQHVLGLKAGDRIAVQLPNLIQYPVVVFGAIRAGLVVVNTNPLYTANEMRHQFNDSGAKALVVFAGCGDRAEQVIKDTPIEHVIVTEVADLHSPFKRLLLNSVVKYIKKMVPKYNIPGAISLNQALEQGREFDHAPANPGPEDLAILQYTGGTTGVAKGAMLTHGNLVANYLQLATHFGDFIGAKKEVFIGPLPLYHIYAFTLHCMLLLGTGNQSVLIPNPRDIPGFVKELKKWKFTGFAGLNTLFVALANNKEFGELDFSQLKFTASGGMALTMDAAKQWEQVTGCGILEGYGLTETSPAVTFNQPGKVQLGSIGIPIPLTQLKVVDDEGVELPTGQPGELCIRGPQVMDGYWQRPDETAEVMSADGWFQSGDMAILADDGFARIVDRKKDMIIVSGFNVYPNEIEDVVCTMPEVLECAAIGVPDERSGEVVKLFVVRNDDSLGVEQIVEYCRERLTAYKIPRQVEFCDELPKTNVGKVLRRALKSPPTAA
ncbi:long-chain fatty acid--CoA ligase [Motiliproteus coralliicola]|uniref:Long-chain-fatty-acid--CoA ligase n=1 Tax=Motiliproteus coralliicola TaxID=2283196 RepID=A0A369WDC0_9GAMM|nr:long-chain fatty acid--CoA ligase [Motiliproteus coralliicola]